MTMAMSDDTHRFPAFLRTILPLLLLAGAAGTGVVLLKTSPTVPKSIPPLVAAVVEVADFSAQDVSVVVEAFGSVVAARQTPVQPQVTGRVVMLHPQLLPGGLLKQGQPLLKIDGDDYRIQLAETTAQLSMAQVEIEGLGAGVSALRSRAAQVEAELEYLRWNMERLNRLLENRQAGEAEGLDARTKCASQEAVLSGIRAQIREQEHGVAAAEARITVAESRVAAARLALARTHVEVPFDAVVLAESVEVGQLLTPQTVVATLAATDEFWVQAAVPVGQLNRIRFSGPQATGGSPVTITLATGAQPVSRRGEVLRPLGQLNPQGRMAQIVVAIRDPLALDRDPAERTEAIRIGSYVRLAIDAGLLQGVYAIPRQALRENSRLWVRDRDGRLDIRPVDIVWRRQDDVLVRGGFKEGDQLVTTHLASVVPGMPLEVRTPDTDPGVAAERPSTERDP